MSSAGRVALEVVVVLRALAVLAQRADMSTQLVRVGDERAGVAERAEVLARIEAEGATASRRLARADAVALGAVRLARVLDDPSPCRPRASDSGCMSASWP